MTAHESLQEMHRAIADPMAYAAAWKARTARPVIGILPMHFPAELAHAAGALPTLLQDDAEPVTLGQSHVFNFYCGYNRSLVDQVMCGRLDELDAILFGDHCVQLLGTADVMRAKKPDLPILFNQLCTTLDADWAVRETRGTFRQLWTELEDLTGQPIDDSRASTSFVLYNRNRSQIRQLYAARRRGAAISARDMQVVVKSAMVMEKERHVALMDALLADLPAPGPSETVPIFLSGHLCHAPNPVILDLVEACGARVVNDDLFTGWRYIHADIDETLPPVEALAAWYLEKNRALPCPTRTTKGRDWEDYLVAEMRACGAAGLIVLMVKFCEPHMYFYPEIKEAMDREGLPHLLIETEHEEMPLEALATRVETFVEIARRRIAVPAS
jgi:benzoyl-CoA reductase subunit C